MMRSLLLWASENPWLRERMPRLRFVRRAVSRFMPGEDLEAALTAAAALQRRGMGSVLTLLGENVKGQADTAAVVEHYLQVIRTIAERKLDAEVSLKLTHLGLDLDPELAASNLISIAREAAAHGQQVAVDMESTAYTERTLALYRRVKSDHANVGLCLQAYLRRTAADLETLLPLRPTIRLVKGAYAEPATLAFPEKPTVDAQFLTLAQRLILARGDGGGRAIFGTHDRRLVAELIAWASSRGIPPGAYEFHMLFGIARDEQERLAAQGHRVCVLISYGSAWFPWYMRRLAERPANVWFVVKSLWAG